jgi:hypothetical protein
MVGLNIATRVRRRFTPFQYFRSIGVRLRARVRVIFAVYVVVAEPIKAVSTRYSPSPFTGDFPKDRDAQCNTENADDDSNYRIIRGGTKEPQQDKASSEAAANPKETHR